MDFGEAPVTLLHFTPLQDSYGSQSYGRCFDSYSSSGAGQQQQQGPPQIDASMVIDAANPNCSMGIKQPPYDYIGPRSCDAYNSLSMEHNVTYCSQQEIQPPPVQDYDPEFGMLIGTTAASDPPSISADMADVGPPPMQLQHHLDTPMTIDTTVSTSSSYNSFYGSPGPQSTPHSPMSVVGDTATARKGHGISKASSKQRSMKVSRAALLRATSPMFPDQSTPLSTLQRQPSISSISSSRSIDQISNAAFSICQSDPEVYNLRNTSCKSNVSSPSINSLSGFDYSTRKSTSSLGSNGSISGKGSSTDDGTRSCIQLKMPVKYARRISDLDKKILRLQAERSKYLEKAHQTTTSLGTMEDDVEGPNMDAWIFTEKMPEMGKVHLYIFPLGIHELDEALYDDANRLLRQVGGMYLDLQTSINILRSICCKGTLVAEISSCFAYIKSLLQEKQNLKLLHVGDLYSIQLDTEENLADGVQQVEFSEALGAANEVLRCAQLITSTFVKMQMQLQKMRQVASAKVDSCNSICQKLGILDRERRGQIRAVMEGNCTTMASAERAWLEYYQTATQTIKTITNCIHPSTAVM